MKYLWITFLFCLLSLQSVIGQIENKLYIIFDSTQPNQRKIIDYPIFKKGKIKKRENEYYFHQGLYGGYPLTFYTINRKKRQKILLNDLKLYNAQSIAELSKIILPLNGTDRMAFFDNIQRYFIVEKDSIKKIAYIYEVELRLTIE